jgi:hypothetical protein
MGRIAAIRFMGLYLPIMAAFVIVIARSRTPRLFPAAPQFSLDAAILACPAIA